MKALTIAQRRAVELHDQGLSTKQIARVLGCTPNAVSQRRALGLRKLGRSTRTRPDLHPGELPPREREIYDLHLAGLSKAQIAARFYISPNSVKTSLARSRRRLGIRTPPRQDQLDETARRVLELMAAGATQAQVSRMLAMGPSGARSATSRARRFYDVETTQAAIDAAVAAKTISLPGPAERLLSLLEAAGIQVAPSQRRQLVRLLGEAGWLFPQRVIAGIDTGLMEASEWRAAVGASLGITLPTEPVAQAGSVTAAAARRQ